jgi:hypothetical protein
MADSGNLIPISDEQAKAIQEASKAAQEALKALQGAAGFLKEILGTFPQDLVGYLGADWLRVRRAENIARIVEKAKERLEARRAKTEQLSISVALPLLVTAADESRDELLDLWARLLAAAVDPARAKSFRNQFIEAARGMEPLDALVLQTTDDKYGGAFTGNTQQDMAGGLHVRRDEIEISVANLGRLGLATVTNPPQAHVSALGREFLRAIHD